jgi:putative ABC transport system permease protein
MGASRVDVLAIETGDYEALSNGSPLEADIPGEMSRSSAADSPLPAIVSEDWPANDRPGPGDLLSLGLGIGGLQPDVVVVETRASFPGIPSGRPFIVIDLDALESVSDLPLTPTITYLRAGESVADTLTSTVTTRSETARVISRYDLVDELRADPFIGWARLTLDVTFWVAICFGILAAVSSLALTARSRRRDLGYLRTLGLDAGQATRSTFIEQLPAVFLGTLAGGATGIVTTLLLEPSIVLTGFTGATIPIGLEVNWTAVAVMVTSLIAAQSIAIGIFMLVSRHQELSRLLRVGDER